MTSGGGDGQSYHRLDRRLVDHLKKLSLDKTPTVMADHEHACI